jgi:hypothetical protein
LNDGCQAYQCDKYYYKQFFIDFIWAHSFHLPFEFTTTYYYSTITPFFCIKNGLSSLNLFILGIYKFTDLKSRVLSKLGLFFWEPLLCFIFYILLYDNYLCSLWLWGNWLCFSNSFPQYAARWTRNE